MGILGDKLAAADANGENDYVTTGWVCQGCHKDDMDQSSRMKGTYYFKCRHCDYESKDFPVDCPVSSADEPTYMLWLDSLGLPFRRHPRRDERLRF